MCSVAVVAPGSLSAMPVVSERVHPRGLDFHNQRRVMILRDVQGMILPAIAFKKVRNISGGRHTARTVANTYWAFNAVRGCRKYEHNKSGRPAWKMTAYVHAGVLRGPRNPDPLFTRRAKGVGIVSLEMANVLRDPRNPRSAFDRAQDPPPKEKMTLGGHSHATRSRTS